MTSNEDHKVDGVYVQAGDGTLQASEDEGCIEVWGWPGPWNNMAGREFRGRYELSIGRYLHLLEEMKSDGVNSCREVLAAIADKAIQVTA
ncbi:hypothetical protein Tbd_1683 [Thiobacillus denitrificans ATCC 25259]|uniref:Uncharacterized protein n=1 Tax=Thiobacillus denitrificans (strain ATCC 25259 / T1) TaxID=292415 RepID=Q3SI92_THIDA|nr:hypothetical protein Tbd_1683 [Thiobacillus denitrificans ATCC 25259]